MKMRTKLIGLGAAILALGVGTYAFKARSEEAGFGPPFMHHGMGGMRPGMMHGGMMGEEPGMMRGGTRGAGMMGGGMMGGGMMGMAHDSATMEQLRVIHTLFVNHDRIKRTVANLPSGIRTVTEFGRSADRGPAENSRRRHDEARRRRGRSGTSDRERRAAFHLPRQGQNSHQHRDHRKWCGFCANFGRSEGGWRAAGPRRASDRLCPRRNGRAPHRHDEQIRRRYARPYDGPWNDGRDARPRRTLAAAGGENRSELN